jgi:hypothetical protein
MPTVSFRIAPPSSRSAGSYRRGATAASLTRSAGAAVVELRRRTTEGPQRERDTVAGAAVSDIAPTDRPQELPEPEQDEEVLSANGFSVRVIVAPPTYDDSKPMMRQLTAETALQRMADSVEQVGGVRLGGGGGGGDDADARVASLHAVAGAELNAYCGPSEPMARYRVVRKAQVRSGAGLGTAKVGTLRRGEEIVALERREDATFGLRRVRFSRGWVSEHSAGGEVILERVEEGMSGVEGLGEGEGEVALPGALLLLSGVAEGTLLEGGRGGEDGEVGFGQASGRVGHWLDDASSSSAAAAAAMGGTPLFCRRCNAVFLPQQEGLCPEYHSTKMYDPAAVAVAAAAVSPSTSVPSIPRPPAHHRDGPGRLFRARRYTADIPTDLAQEARLAGAAGGFEMALDESGRYCWRRVSPPRPRRPDGDGGGGDGDGWRHPSLSASYRLLARSQVSAQLDPASAVRAP